MTNVLHFTNSGNWYKLWHTQKILLYHLYNHGVIHIGYKMRLYAYEFCVVKNGSERYSLRKNKFQGMA